MNALLESLVKADEAATLWLNTLTGPWADGFWAVMSDVSFWFPFYAAFMVFALVKLGWKKGLAVILSLIVTVVLADQGGNLVKAAVARLRPCYDVWMVNNGLRLPYGLNGEGAFGFFSSHASNSFGFATVSYLGLKWNKPEGNFKLYGWCIYLWALCMSLSRIMMGAHYLGDITVGALVGVGIGLATAWAASRLTAKG